MIPLGLSASEQVQFHKGLVDSHAIRVGVRVLDLDHNVMSVVRGRVLSGQVDVDVSGDVERTASLTILDQDGALNLDAPDARAGGAFMDRMVAITYGVWSVYLPRWVDVPVFVGPITSMSRDGAVVTLGAQGKESLLLGPCSYNYTYPKGAYKTGIITDLLARNGEQFMDVPQWNTKTTKPVTLAPLTTVWPLVKSVARSWGEGNMTYDGRGYARLHRYNRSSIWTFHRGRGGSLTSEPKLTYNMENVRNLVVVTGATPSGAKRPVQAVAHAQASHPLSSTNLGRGGAKRYLREDVQDDTITTTAQAQTLANNLLAGYLQAGVTLDFEAMVIPHLEPNDVVTVVGSSWTFPMTMHRYTIPLTHDGNMSVGRTYATRTVRRARPVARKGPRKGK